MADIGMGPAFRHTRHHRQDRLFAIERLDLALLIDAQDQRPISRLLNFSPRLADEPGIVTVVEEEVADETAGGSDLDPTASRALITLVDALP